MRPLYRVIPWVLMLGGLTPTGAGAWGWDGHRIVCAIAWEQLSPDIRARLARVLEADGKEAFVESCLWPDDVRPWRPETGPHPYVNLPRGASAIVLERDCPPDKGCVAKEVLNQAGEMRRSYSRDALRFVGHFVGDLHQPLHAGYGDDAGGNAIRGKFMANDVNMHGLWDYGLLEATGRAWREVAADLNGRITQGDRWTWTAGTVLDRTNATLGLALSSAVACAGAAQPFDLGRDYLGTNLPTVES